MTTATYNGWTNYETWNVALYINNEYDLYKMALDYVKQCDRLGEWVEYKQLVDVIKMHMGNKTPDGVKWDDNKVDYDEMDIMLKELID